MKKYLLAVDGSDNSKRAALFLLEMVKDSGAFEISVVNVINVRKELYNYSLLTDISKIEDYVREKSQQAVNEISRFFEHEGLKVNKVLLEGDPGYEIAEYARLGNFNQIIMGTRGLGNIKGLVMGSVSHKVVHYAGTPVTLVK